MSSFSTPTKHESITELLAERISQGAYLHGQLPGERALAIELGVSYLTVRKATKQLLKDGLLARTPKGRLMPCASQESQKRGPQIGLLVDTIPEVSMSAWLNDLDAVVKAKNGTLRLISYSHETDPRVFEALDAELDGLVIVYRYELSPLLRDRLIQNRHRVVSLWFDMTAMGIPSIETAPAHFVSKAVDHLKSLGHKRVDFLCASDRDTVLCNRIHYWQQAVNHYQLQGELFEQLPKRRQSSALSAYDLAMDLHANGKLAQMTSVVCATSSMAVGFQRACHEVGLIVGRDISVVGYGELDVAQMSVPSITTVRPGPRTPLLEQGLDWILSPDNDDQKPLYINSVDVDLFIGESTAPAPNK
ncbi:MAG TPA: hypothetical protein DER01_06845 [Phycisphaerales bacterium]|nr:hypothetical protein [Phycisphaerales bacterium]